MTEDFNQPSRKGSWLKAGALAAGILFLAGLSGWVIWRLLHHPDVPRDPAVQQEWKPSASNPALVLPAVEVQYRDLGESVELSIVSVANPIIYVDVNQNRTVDAGAISYAARPDNAVCVTHLDRPVDVHCGGEVSHASVAIENVGGSKRTVWNIPKRELQSGRRYADIVIQTFHEDTQQGEFYPQAALFQKVYRLDFAEEDRGSANIAQPRSDWRPNGGTLSIAKPAVSDGTVANPGTSPFAPPQIVDFSATPVSADPSAGFRLKWKVLGASSTDIQPSPPGPPYEAIGERVVMPGATTTYVLTAKKGMASVKKDLTITVVPVAAPRIAEFSADSSVVVPGGATRLHWNVEGRVSDVRIDPLGDGFPAQGSHNTVVENTTEYTLVAQGPGGSVSSETLVRAEYSGPPVITFTANPSAVHPGEPVLLTWSVRFADSISIDSGIGHVASSGNIEIHPVSNAHYTIQATGHGGSSSRDVFVSVSRIPGPSRGQLVWTGQVHGTQLVSIDRDHADVGQLEGSLPGEPCILQLATDKNVSIASAPGPRNNYERVVLRVKGNGPMRVTLVWVIQ